MPAFRYFIDQPLTASAHLTLEGDELHHLKTVMRAQTQDPIELVNGRNVLAEGKILDIQKHTAHIHIQNVQTTPPPIPLILAQALPKTPRLDYILEKGTELGVTEFWLFPSINSEKKEISQTQLQRLKHITIAAMKQCGRLDLPHIEIKKQLSLWKPHSGNNFFGDTDPNAPLFGTTPVKKISTLFFIGPEKGFHPKEILLLQNTLHATGVKLHPHVLRTETAAVTAATLASYFLHLHPCHHLP